MSGLQLWYKRVKQDWQYQSKNILSILDWTIILYLLIPFLAFVGIAYHSWWFTVPNWLIGLPPSLYFLGCYFICWQGRLRTFMEEADQLYLLQYPKKTVSMRYMGALYSSVVILIKWVAMFLLLFPITNHFSELEIGQFTAAIIYFFSLNLLLSTYEQKVYHYRFLKKFFLHVFVFISFAFLSYLLINQLIFIVLIMVSIIFIGLAIWQIKLYQSQFKSFYTDVEKGQRNKVKLISFMFAINPEINLSKVKKPKKHSLVLWRNSTRIFINRAPENGVTELFIKAFLREKANVFNYIQILSVTITLIFVTPIWLKWCVFIAFWFFFKEWVILLFKEIIKQNPYLAIDYSQKEYIFQAQKMCEKRFVYPGVSLVFLFASLSTVIAIFI
ncbi:ABC transporter permease [Metabacillus bambusae]|uniref:ABC transporter permease n=1 Tax=Metabacillus bambusae TaxID=2795218 RepID=A0ABS3N4F0_9BACI|nr:ABC transporter permease [Metabacillus bambusae]MBO1513181.1 ABC transporter permease [Metabacillus bambusae]